jgi:DNA (cytosine-5)-methyltransferase 1
MTIPIIDIFAGPGGLGEGFSSYLKPSGARAFEIGLSVEKDLWAHKTLLLRSFFRQFQCAPVEYYQYLQGEIDRDTLLRWLPRNRQLPLGRSGDVLLSFSTLAN